MVAVGVMVGSLVIGGALASGRLRVQRHDWARPKLQEYYAAIGRLTEKLPANLSTEEFELYVLRVNHRVSEAADWIGTNLGGSARAKFLDTHGMPPGDYGGPSWTWIWRVAATPRRFGRSR